MPAALVLDTPGVDLTLIGDSWNTNLGLDHSLGATSTAPFDLYIGDHDPHDAYLSPVYGNLSGLPPTLLLTGTRDRLLSDTVRMHRALRTAGVAAELHVWEAAPHTMFGGLSPEDADRARELRNFVEANRPRR